MNPTEIGKRIRRLRGKESRRNLASKLAISPSALAMYENGQRIPRDEVKERIAAHFHVPISEIFFATNEHK